MAGCVSVSSTMMMVAPASVSVSSSKSVSFNNGGLRVSSLTAQASPRPARSLCVRAEGDPRNADDETVGDKVKNALADLQLKVQDDMPDSNSGNQSSVGSPGRKPGVGRQGQPDHKSSTGGISQVVREMAERAAIVFDGMKENVTDKLQDDGRDLKSKTGDVNYGAHRNADGIPSDVTQKNIQEQSEYTKNLGKKN